MSPNAVVRPGSALLDAAADAFSEAGFGHATVEQICERAGYSRGAFYSNFDSLDELFFAMWEQRSASMLADLRLATESITAGNTVDIHAAVARIVAVVPVDPQWYRINAEFTAHALRNPALRKALADREDAILRTLLPHCGVRTQRRRANNRRRPDGVGTGIGCSARRHQRAVPRRYRHQRRLCTAPRYLHSNSAVLQRNNPEQPIGRGVVVSEQADVIVVGAGLAGLVATYELTRAGRKVLVVEQENAANLGAQAFWSLGGLFLVNSPEQRRLGIKDSLELAMQDWMGTAGFDREREDHWPRSVGQGVRRVRSGRQASVPARSGASP